VLSDALRDDTAAQYMGYLQHLVETRQATRFTCVGELPSMSRPMYETIHTGVYSSVHGVTHNDVVRMSNMPNVFMLTRDAGKVTAASAYSWFSELYNRAPYDIVADREVDDPALAIQHGRFYREYPYPDIEVIAAGGALVMKFQPDYLLIHPMMGDYFGEKYGGLSAEYRHTVIVQDQALAAMIPLVRALGYDVVVTGDHGMDDQAGTTHGGALPQHRLVPFYHMPANGEGRGDTGERISQLQIAPTLCAMLGIEAAPAMRATPITLTRPS
ncbi:MAG TPA: alkaline phosphatase family protein, partial [Candidatus Limnocylindrales bacterium]|nr:alkaline phosphatase family protein [Candidatus Limnocylindrales bacterium]